MKIPAWLQKQLAFTLAEAGDVVRAYNTDAKNLGDTISRLQKSLHWLRKRFPKYMFDDEGVKWFVTTLGYQPQYILYGSRTVGYFDKEVDAVECILENHGDIHEFSYSYAIIEPFGSGLYPDDSYGNERFFWWYAGRYMEIGRPHWARQTCNWGLG